MPQPRTPRSAAMPAPHALAAAATLLPLLAGAQIVAPPPGTATPACEQAMLAYNTMRSRTTMDESQYAQTPEAGAVRAACNPGTLSAMDNANLNPLRPRAQPQAPVTASPPPSPGVSAPAPVIPSPPYPPPSAPTRIISPTPAAPAVRAMPTPPPAVRATPPGASAPR